MQLNPAPDDLDNAFYCHLASPTGLVHLAVHPVLYGFRVRGYFADSGGSQWDWCAGGEQQHLEILYSLARSILLQREESKQAFQDLPGHSAIKPYFLDGDFTAHLIRAAGPEVEVFCLPPVAEIRQRYLEHFAQRHL